MFDIDPATLMTPLMVEKMKSMDISEESWRNSSESDTVSQTPSEIFDEVYIEHLDYDMIKGVTNLHHKTAKTRKERAFQK